MYDIENELVHQKDAIRKLIGFPVTPDGVEQALVLLAFSEELWAKAGYAYKTKELREEIRRQVQDEANTPGQHWKTQAKWTDLLKKL